MCDWKSLKRQILNTFYAKSCAYKGKFIASMNLGASVGWIYWTWKIWLRFHIKLIFEMN